MTLNPDWLGLNSAAYTSIKIEAAQVYTAPTIFIIIKQYKRGKTP